MIFRVVERTNFYKVKFVNKKASEWSADAGF